MDRIIISSVSGTLFGVGLGVSEIINPGKILAFLDVAGNLDPSLAFVLFGAFTCNNSHFPIDFETG